MSGPNLEVGHDQQGSPTKDAEGYTTSHSLTRAKSELSKRPQHLLAHSWTNGTGFDAMTCSRNFP